MAAASGESEKDAQAREEQEVYAWRYGQARDLGCSVKAATAIAESDSDIEQFRKLVAVKGCLPNLAARIVA